MSPVVNVAAASAPLRNSSSTASSKARSSSARTYPQKEYLKVGLNPLPKHHPKVGLQFTLVHQTSQSVNSAEFGFTEFYEVRAWKDEHEGRYHISKITLSLPPVVTPSFLRAAKYEELEQQETRRRADQHRGELSHVAPDQRREVRVGHESMRHKPQHYGAYPYAHRCLEAERSYLLRIVAGVVSEGPERIPQIAVGVREGQGNEVVEEEYLRAAGWV